MMAEDSDSSQVSTPRQRRLKGSCDLCRKRKVKCDSAERSNNECSNCRKAGVPCTHDSPPLKRNMPNDTRRVHQLELRTKALEKELEHYRKAQALDKMPESTFPQDVQESSDNDDDSDAENLQIAMKQLSLNAFKGRYFGPSSNLFFMQKTMAQGLSSTFFNSKRSMASWETDNVYQAPLIFPEDDLLNALIDSYFSAQPAHLPVLYKPHFLRDVSLGRHFSDITFGAVVLLVCAIASRVSNDPRVLVDGVSRQSAGWPFASQTTTLRRPMFGCPTMEDVQICCLTTQYITTTSNPMSIWSTIGLGIRYAVELGYHRQRTNEERTVDSELRKKLFWILLYWERYICLYCGRPISIRLEDVDVEFPVECDDEFWETESPDRDFQQPVGKPARVAGLLHHFRMVPILSVILTSLHGVKQPKDAAGLKTQSTIVTVDSMLNSWFNSIPSHLRWDPLLHPNEFFSESAILYSSYYTLQIIVHRPFIHKSSAQALPSLVICTNAARSLSKVLETLQERRPTAMFFVHISAFVAGMTLAANMRKRKETDHNWSYGGHDLEDLNRCIRILYDSSVRYGYDMCDQLLHILRSIADLPMTNAQQNAPHGLSSFTAPPSGYKPAPVSLSTLDPTLFGLNPHVEEQNSGYAHVDMSLFEDVDMWLGQGLEKVGDPEADSSVPFSFGALLDTMNWNV